MQVLKQVLLAQKLDHVDETGARVKGLLQWFHVHSTRWLTLSQWHRQRGQKAMDAIGMLPESRGRAIHDRGSSDDRDGCVQSVCAAHLFREWVVIAERDHQAWAHEMHDLVERMSRITARFREAGAHQLPKAEPDGLVLQDVAILEQGVAFHRMHAPPPDAPVPTTPGRRTHADAQHLLDALLARAEQLLAFLDDLAVPFPNTQAERDLRMVNVQHTMSGTCRSAEGATAFCLIRRALSTMSVPCSLP